MELLRRRACARAGLMGNPSDGYHGKTLSILVRNYFAEVVLYEWEDFEIVLAEEEDILMAMRMIFERMKIVVEPSSAVPLAVLLSGKVNAANKNVGIILSGGNVDFSHFFKLLKKGI